MAKILSELYRTFHPINTHNKTLVRLSPENLYHNLFSDLDLEHPDRSRFLDLKGYTLTTVRGWRLATKIKYVFQNIIDRADELILDTPDIVNILGKFIARAYCEKILPQKFIEIGKA